MTELQLRKYSDLLLWCIGGAKNRNVLIVAEPVHRRFAVQLARAAYSNGARLVEIEYREPLLIRARVELAAEKDLAAHPRYHELRSAELAGDEWALIHVHGSEEPDHMAGMNPKRIAAFAKARREVMMPVLEQITGFRKHWVGALMPTGALASRSCPDLDPEAALERYDHEIVRVLSLDDEDPVNVWESRFSELSVRRDIFTGLKLESLHITGPGTDLHIGLHTGGKWATAEAIMPDGKTVYVNIPSLEIFTTPDFRRTSGRVAATRPYRSLASPGTLISGAWFEFDHGRVVNFGADSGREVLEHILDMDEQARYLGEISLVDSESAVARAEFTFFDTLYDENAASHMALGRGFPGLVDGVAEREPADLLKAGVNHSLVHDDIMIGSPQVDVTGRAVDGTIVPLMTRGRFADDLA